ncbi:SGNH/GDSL hydrolase family protein [Oceanidesulfovibrio indonesiensis]|uniref:SGNH/GDSL hydrolase family protein n=1 Tax=Oceanidesulfovibrio indonesiensis TaxID=54767 RepID=A0A7M3MEI9_9BACT|nr:SGNH/GDSL hydrolase family protein [Oceanidesulfovibrio indonesiensis]TVM17315.1 SGNH/GDSL hydrolase family protein [Oceanidesulfovibrio indonesiensis]
MRSLLRALCKLLKWGLIAVVLVELGSFAVISVSNLLIYGELREGSRVRYDPYALFLNLRGPRPTTPQPESPEYSVWCFGGSTMRGQTADDSATIPSLLSRELTRRNHSVALHNWGEDSFNSLLETNYLQKLLIEHGDTTDLLLFYDGANDSIYFTQYRTPYGHHGYRRLSGLIESYRGSFFGIFKSFNAAVRASFTRELYDKLGQAVSPIDPDDPYLELFTALVEQRYDYLAHEASLRGDAFMVVWQPVLWAENAGAVDENVRAMEADYLVNRRQLQTMNDNFRMVYEALRSRLADKPYFVDMGDALTNRSEQAYQPDGVHLTDVGRQMIAAQLAPRIIEQKMRAEQRAAQIARALEKRQAGKQASAGNRHKAARKTSANPANEPAP